jgi:hypothetical protein
MYDIFQNVIDDLNPGIVFATETWLSQNIRDGEIGAPQEFSCNYNIHRHGRQTQGGGVFIAIRNLVQTDVTTNTRRTVRWSGLE